MKKLVFVVMFAALLLGGCKTSESNYRAAYEVAKQKKNDSAVDSVTLAKIARTDLPQETTLEGVKLPMRTFPIGYAKDGGASREVVKHYNVVVGQFRQIFNAKAMRERLMAAGYGGAFVLNDRDQNYYVVAASCATPLEAAEALEKVRKDPTISLKEPLPWILRPAHLAR